MVKAVSPGLVTQRGVAESLGVTCGCLSQIEGGFHKIFDQVVYAIAPP